MNSSTYRFYAESLQVARRETSLAPLADPSMEARLLMAKQNAHQESEREIWARENAAFLEAYNARIERGEISFAEFRGL